VSIAIGTAPAYTAEDALNPRAVSARLADCFDLEPYLASVDTLFARAEEP